MCTSGAPAARRSATTQGVNYAAPRRSGRCDPDPDRAALIRVVYLDSSCHQWYDHGNNLKLPGAPFGVKREGGANPPRSRHCDRGVLRQHVTVTKTGRRRTMMIRESGDLPGTYDIFSPRAGRSCADLWRAPCWIRPYVRLSVFARQTPALGRAGVVCFDPGREVPIEEDCG
jgi:hypothetical protein